MNFKNETGYAKRQTYRQPLQTNRQSAIQLEQQKADQITAIQASNQNKSTQPSGTSNVPSQEYTESQPASSESTQHQFPARTAQPQTASEYFYVSVFQCSLIFYTMLRCSIHYRLNVHLSRNIAKFSIYWFVWKS